MHWGLRREQNNKYIFHHRITDLLIQKQSKIKYHNNKYMYIKQNTKTSAVKTYYVQIDR